MRIRLAVLIGICCMLLTACSPVIRTAGDELRLFRWSGDYENGNTASLRFDDGTAAFDLKNKDFELHIGGLCSMTDDSFVILNEDDGVGYTFGYRLHGDCVELYYRGGSLTLDKIGEESGNETILPEETGER